MLFIEVRDSSFFLSSLKVDFYECARGSTLPLRKHNWPPLLKWLFFFSLANTFLARRQAPWNMSLFWFQCHTQKEISFKWELYYKRFIQPCWWNWCWTRKKEKKECVLMLLLLRLICGPYMHTFSGREIIITRGKLPNYCPSRSRLGNFEKSPSIVIIIIITIGQVRKLGLRTH